MSWFKYLDLDGKDAYPNLKKKITFPTPKESIAKNDWLFADITDLNIDTFYTLTQTNAIFEKSESIEPDSYLVVYEDVSVIGTEFVPVITQIVGNLLYFKAAEDHPKDININKQYSLYYKTPNLKLIKKVSTNYQACQESEAEFVSSEEDVNPSSYVRNLTSTTHYALSFVNTELNWKEGVSISSGASLIGTFTGPNLFIYSDKGPDYGKFKLRITSYGEDTEVNNKVELDWTYVDLYSQTKTSESLVFSKTNLSYKTYVFELVSDFEKNLLSSDGKINIKKYTFSLDNSLTLEKEEISSTLLARVITGAA